MPNAITLLAIAGIMTVISNMMVRREIKRIKERLNKLERYEL